MVGGVPRFPGDPYTCYGLGFKCLRGSPWLENLNSDWPRSVSRLASALLRFHVVAELHMAPSILVLWPTLEIADWLGNSWERYCLELQQCPPLRPAGPAPVVCPICQGLGFKS